MKSIIKYRFLLRQLVRTNVLARYRKTRLGLFWMLLSPVLTVLVWTILHSSGLFDPGHTGIPYAAYVFVGSTLWTFFFEAYRSVSDSVTLHGRLLLSHPLPYGSVVLERTGFHFIHSIVPLLANIPVILLFGVSPQWTWLLFPLVLLPLLVAGIAAGMFAAVLKVVAQDFSNVMDEVMKIGKFLCPVVYAAHADLGFLSNIVYWNPMTYLISLPRDMLTGQGFGLGLSFLLASLLVSVLFIIGWRFYHRAAPLLLERLFAN